MKDLIRNIIKEYVNEALIRSTQPDNERYEIIANKVIDFMDHFKAKSIPDYRFLQDWKPNKDDSYRPNFKYDLQKFLRRGEYDNFVKPLIQSKRPEFIYSKGSGKKHRVDEFVAVYSNGEKIVYNTFKMNGIILIFEPKQFQFEYEIDGETKTKRPDFYWEENKEIIEVAGLEDKSFGKNYTKQLIAAKEQLQKIGTKITILDYFSYRKDLQGFYKYVCETFGFPYDPMDFWTVNISRGIDVEELKREVEELIKKGAEKTYGERWRQNKIITQLLTKPQEQGDTGKPEGYTSASEFKRETGIGLRESDPELKKQIQKAWCLSSGSNMGTYLKFKEIFQNIPLSKSTIEKMRKRFTEDFNPEKRDEICKDYPL